MYVSVNLISDSYPYIHLYKKHSMIYIHPTEAYINGVNYLTSFDHNTVLHGRLEI